MSETKRWWESKTVWGGMVAVLAGAAGMFGVAVDGGAQTEVVGHAADIAAAVGGVVSILGRLQATRSIG